MSLPKRRALVWCAAVAAILAGCRAGPPEPGGSRAASPEPTAGWVIERVDVGGHKLNIICRGSGSPTIVFENGMDQNLGTWFRSVAHAFPLVRTCVYDRVNTGASDRIPVRHTGADSVRDLHALLDVAAIPPPYLLVGHSFGGLLAAMYAGTYPREVVGLVLVDPTLATDAGLLDLVPPPHRAAAVAAEDRNAENVGYLDTLEQAKPLVAKIPNIPVIVLVATAMPNTSPAWLAADIFAARKDDLRLFTEALPRGELRYVDSGHFIQHDAPQLVIGEIRRVLNR